MNADRRKLIFFSGCSFAYGLNSGIIDEAYGGEYAVFNMGVNGDINAAFQMEILLAYMGEGDVFIHAPEEMSASQLMFDYFVNDSMFIMTEGNYDLLALVDFSDNGGVIRAFFDYIEFKRIRSPAVMTTADMRNLIFTGTTFTKGLTTKPRKTNATLPTATMHIVMRPNF